MVAEAGAEVLEFVADASRRAAPIAERPTGVLLSAMRYDEGMPWLRLSPAAWPVLVGGSRRIGWCMKSAGDAVDVRAVELRLSAACDVQVQRLKLDAFPFHAGQVSGGAIAGFEWRSGGWLARRAVADRIEVSGFNVPGVTPATRNEYLIMLTVELAARGTADVTVWPAIVHGGEPPVLPLPSVRVGFIEPGWRPGVLQPLRERRSTADDPPAPEPLRLDAMLRLNMPGVRSAAAVLEGAIAGRTAAARLIGAAVDAWGSVPGVSIELQTERRMSAMGNVTKGTKRFASDDASAARAVARALEDPGQQSVWIDVSRSGAFAPFAGALLQMTLQHDSRSADADDPGTCVCAVWAIVADDGEDGATADAATGESSAAVDASRHLDTARRVQAAFENSLADCAPVQGWATNTAWIPTFMTADDWAPTPYEICAGLWTGSAAACMGAHWCARYLRMMAPTLWLGAALAAQVDRQALARVADVSSAGATTRVALRPGHDLSLLDAALAPLWPPPPTGYR